MTSTIDWPLGLPYPLLGTAVTTAEGRIMTQGDIATTERVVYPNYRKTLPVRWHFTAREKQAFEGWHVYYLDDGLLWFNADWLDGNMALVRFVAPYQVTSNGIDWTVSSTVEIDSALSR